MHYCGKEQGFKIKRSYDKNSTLGPKKLGSQKITDKSRVL
jgi:hypothetical protein